MTAPRTEEELKKLTVAVLKAICKEYGLTGYSKLAKPAIIARILAHESTALSAPATSKSSLSPKNKTADVALAAGSKRPNDDTNAHAQPALKKAKPSETVPKNNTQPLQLPVPQHPDLVQQPSQPAPVQQKIFQPAEASRSPQLSPPVTQHPTVVNTASATLQPSGNLPPVQPSTCPPKPAVQALHKQPVQSADPVRNSKPHGSKPTTAAPTGTVGTLKTPGKRFTPLVINRTVSAKAFEIKKPANPVPYLDFVGDVIVPSLGSISFPPSLAERKKIDRVSLALSQVDKADLGQCVQVSRMFRYAVYLSAQPRLLRKFQGLRLASVMNTYQRRLSTTNLWPYLKVREQELYNVRQMYNESFLGAYFKGKNVICERLWTNPDHEKQITIAIRFLLTKLFFSFSVGDGRDGSSWMEGCITDAQQVVKDEIWRITVRNGLQVESFYVLEATCEVIGHPPPPPSSDAMQVDSSPLRADWSLYINTRTPDGPNLLEHLVWTNHEEYDKGISRVWLKRIANEGENGAFARLIAERYILACVVGNSVSGQWKSATEMRQDFSGLPQQTAQVQPKTLRLNLFLPQHHYVESVHFTTSSRKPLHPALAVVQTPGREFIILKDNGMQVGCEEEGVAAVWTKLIECDSDGGVQCEA